MPRLNHHHSAQPTNFSIVLTIRISEGVSLVVKCQVSGLKVADTRFNTRIDNATLCRWENALSFFLLRPSWLLIVVALPDERLAKRTQKSASALVWTCG